jgi:hypothetical protein
VHGRCPRYLGRSDHQLGRELLSSSIVLPSFNAIPELFDIFHVEDGEQYNESDALDFRGH